MTLDRLEPRAQKIADRAAVRTRDAILVRSNPPPGVTTDRITGGILLSGKNLRRRFISDPQLRNFLR